MNEIVEVAHSKSYTITEKILNQADIKKLNKAVSASILVNFILLPFWVLIYFSATFYFWIFAIVLLILHIGILKDCLSILQELENTKIVFTGIVTSITINEETFIFLGQEEFDITYANANFPLNANDLVSIYYSKKKDNTKGRILSVEKIEDIG